MSVLDQTHRIERPGDGCNGMADCPLHDDEDRIEGDARYTDPDDYRAQEDEDRSLAGNEGWQDYLEWQRTSH
jgi:hypothetical protein